MRITLKQLRTFDAIARSGNVSRAAEEIALSQSAASMALAELEQHLGASLFHRQGKRLALNDYGRWLQPQVYQLLQQAQAIELSARSDELQGRLVVGASSTIGNYLLPALIAHFVQLHPAVQLDLKVGNTEQVVDDMLHMRIDIGLIEGPCHSHKLLVQRWRSDELCIFCSPGHPLATRQRPGLKALQQQRWILREAGSGTREVFAIASQGKLDPVDVILELGNSEAVKQAVKTGVGLGCLSRLAIAAEIEHGELHVLPTRGLDLRRDFFMLQPAKSLDSTLMKTFKAAIS